MVAYVLVLIGFIAAGQAPIVVASPYPTRDSCERSMVDTLHKISLSPEISKYAPVAFCRKVEKPDPL